MESPDDFEAGLERVATCLERAGERVSDRQEVEPLIGESGPGFVVSHGTHNLLALGDPDRWFVRIVFPFSVVDVFVQQAAIQAPIPDDPDHGQEIDVEVDDTHQQQGVERALESLRNQDPDKKAKLRRKIVQKLSRPGHGVSYNLLQASQHANADTEGVLGFQTETRVWPWEDTCSPSDVYIACQTAVSTAIPVATLLQQQFGISGSIEDVVQSASVSTPEDREPRSFH